ncbi:MAG: CBASS cGAMP synthase [Candidatus Sedimenticola sp. (ex Thyasira tokunagai)]
MYNTSPLLYKHIHTDRFINNISISSGQDDLLLAARKKIRQTIRAAFAEARAYLKGVAGIQERDIEWISNIKPKFMTQVSYAYKTINSPCHPTQEIDLDDGIYLPMSIMRSAPEANKDWFFKIIDGALKKLAHQEGWVFTDEKDTCSRLIIPNRQAHIDIPLYAVPDQRHENMTEALAALKVENRQLSEIIYRGDIKSALPYLLDEDEVYLATRSNGWQQSDPLLIANWFRRQIDIRGQESGRRLRRICRFLKSWRDFVWENGGPSSLTLMICAAEAYPEDDRGRDDYALVEVAKTLPQQLRGSVKNPATTKEEIVYPRGDMNTEEIATAASNLVAALESALSGAVDKGRVIQSFVGQFGDRIPRKPECIEEVGSAEIVRATPAVTVKPDPIPNARSG